MTNFINFSNHPSVNWSVEQRIEAEKFGRVIDVPFPSVKDDADERDIAKLAENSINVIMQHDPAVVMVQGEFTLSVAVINGLQSRGIRCCAACSTRESKEEILPDGSIKKENIFRFNRFRMYSAVQVPKDQTSAADEGSEDTSASNRRNVLILNLSTFAPQSELKNDWKYTLDPNYVGEFNHDSEYAGSYQLEPIPKLLIDNLSQNGKQLDEVIMFATKEVKTPVNKTFVDVNDPDKKESICLSPAEYFRKTIEDYTAGLQKVGRKVNTPKFTMIDIADISPEGAVGECIDHLRVMTKQNTEPMKIYIDIHGGFREFNTIALSLLSVLEKEGIPTNAEDIWTVNTIGRNAGSMTNSAPSAAFRTYELMSGMDAFFNYGKAKNLRQFFAEDSGIEKEWMETIADISNAILLCDMDQFAKNLQVLARLDQADYNTEKNQYFRIFRESIKNDYGKLLEDHTTLDEIAWCVKKEFIQQALTLVESHMPEYIVGSKYLKVDMDAVGQEKRADFKLKKTKEAKNVLDNNGAEFVIEKEYNWEEIPESKITVREALNRAKNRWDKEKNALLMCWANQEESKVMRHADSRYLPLEELREKSQSSWIRDYKPKNPAKMQFWLKYRFETVEACQVDPEKQKDSDVWNRDIYEYRKYQVTLSNEVEDKDMQKWFRLFMQLHMTLKNERNQANHGVKGSRVSAEAISKALEVYIELANKLQLIS